MKIYSLPYTLNLIEHYQAFSDLEGFALLESRDTRLGRYDILTALPYERIRIDRNEQVHSPSIYKWLKNKLAPTQSICDLPFQGGAIGYFAYDFGAKLLGVHSEPHPLWQEMPLMDLGLYDWAIVTDHELKKVHLLVSDEQTKKRMYERWFDHQCYIEPFVIEKAFKPIIEKESYENAYDAIWKALRAGRVYQVNLTQPFLAIYKGNVWDLYEQIRLQNPVPYSSFLHFEHFDILSFSPERFLTIDEGHVLTSPIKGTAKRSVNLVEDDVLRKALMACPKNRAENVMIVDLMRNDLGKFAESGSVNVPILCELQSYHKVHHLVSHVEAKCRKDISPIEAFLNCFPGGSITGAPKLEAMRMIAEEERFARGIYCGSIAYFSKHGRLDSNIAIRTITAKDGKLYLPAGGGIVMDSICEEEYQECFTKIAAFVTKSR